MPSRVRTSDPSGYPYAIVSKLHDAARDGAGAYELHFLDAGPKVAWREYADELRRSGRYEWVRFTTMNFMDDDTGEMLGR